METNVPFQDNSSWTVLLTSTNQANKEKRGVIFKRAESYVKEYRDAEREKIRLNRLSKQEGSFFVEAEPKLVFVIRIKG
jgi:large subunit ribosomal protein L7e